MSTFTQRIASIAFGVVLAVGGLAGCGGGAATNATPEPTSAAEVAKLNAENPDNDNYHGEATMEAKISVLGMEMPMTFEYTVDSTADAAHSSTKMSGNFMGQTQESTTEQYVVKEGDKYVMYSGTSDATGEDAKVTWTKSTTEESTVMSEKIAAEDVLKDADFEKTDDGYVLTVSGDKFSDMLNSMNLNLDELMGSLGDDWAQTASEESKATYYFDKDCRLTQVTLTIGYTFSYTGEDTAGYDASMLNMGVSLDLDMTMSGYGTITDDKVAVPEEVASSATEETASSATEEEVDAAA